MDTSAAIRAFGTTLANGPDLNLDEACLYIAAAVASDPAMIVDRYVSRIDDIARVVSSPSIIGIAQHLFGGPDAFVGNEADYYNPSNSLLDQVLLHRRGIPISLAVLMISVGKRLGVELCGVGMPGHFLVGSGAPFGTVPDVFVDPFHGGTQLDTSGARALFERMTGGTHAFDLRFLAAVHPFAILDRYLSNLKFIYAGLGEQEHLRSIMALRSRIPGLGQIEREEFLRLMAPFN